MAALFEFEELFEMTEEQMAVNSETKLVDEAFVSCMNNLGRFSMEYMISLTGLSAEEIADRMDGEIFEDPKLVFRNLYVTETWVLRSAYISGNLKAKLTVAKAGNRKFPGRFERNIRELTEALPAKVVFEEIGFTLGNSWIPVHYYEEFIRQLFGFSERPDVIHSETLHKWKITIRGNSQTVKNMFTFGTTKMNGMKILEHTLNGDTIKIYDEVPKPEAPKGMVRILNRTETIAAQEKQEEMRRQFQNWIGESKERRDELAELYYSTFACLVPRRYSGNFLTLPDLNPEIRPYSYQKDAVARCILEPSVLLAHNVGSGKTYILVMAVHERKRLGLSSRNLVIVPNNVLEHFETAHHRLYPDDPILIVHPEDFRPAYREEMMEAMRSEAYTAVYMAFSTFASINLSRSWRLKVKTEEIAELKRIISQMSGGWEKERLKKLHDRRCDQLAKLKEELLPDAGTTFDELGFTMLVVDEVHNFKNVSLETNADSVVGLHKKGSSKCDQMREKVDFIRKNGGSVVFTTGTPITNSISDLYVLENYLMPEQMRLLGMGSFDEWIANFATAKTGFEVDVDSSSFRIMTRFAAFHNMPELISLFGSICDFHYDEEDAHGLPSCTGYRDINVPKSPELSGYVEELAERTERIRRKEVSSEEDNLLKVVHDGRTAALDLRLMEPGSTMNPKTSKAAACAKEVYRIWKEYPGTSQLVFSDLGTPKNGFNLYDELKELLVSCGIPGREIAFIHEANTDAKRRTLFEKVNRAQVRVLIGSTVKLGTGVNVQEQLIAIHHLDVPWRPADMIQREGRLIRQGNANPTVFRFRYITPGTFDAYSWQILENKQRFIAQFMASTCEARDVRDMEDSVLSYAEIKALSVGNPLLKKRIETGNTLERTKVSRRQRAKELADLSRLVERAPEKLKKLETVKEKLEQDFEHFEQTREKMSRSERLAFGEELLLALEENIGALKERWFGDLFGFRVILPKEMKETHPYVLVKGPGELDYRVSVKDATAAGCVQRFEYVLSHLENRIGETTQQILETKREVETARAELRIGNLFEAKIRKLETELMSIDEELNAGA